MDDYERILLVKPDVMVYRIPPRTTNRSYRASDWNLDAPDWTCRLRLISKGSECFIKLDEKSTGQFFGQCPIDKYPGPAVESVSDSSRYFVLKLVNEQTKRNAFVGIGFVDRSDSFDLNVALQDHFKILQMESDTSGKEDENAPKLDLGFKEGQTIKVNLNLGKKAGAAKPRPKGTGQLGILLPPPPAGGKSGPPAIPNNSKASPTNISTASSSTSSDITSEQHSNANFHQQLLDGLESLSMAESAPKSIPAPKSGVPMLTPANSVCAGDDFALFTSSSDNVISANGNGSGSKKTDEDLWSDFESFRNESSNAAASADNPSAAATSFDDWAKF